jgi:hypothetical protein
MNLAFPRMHDALIVSEQGNVRIIAIPAGHPESRIAQIAEFQKVNPSAEL